MKNNQVVGIGEALWDMLPEGRKIGGAPANFAYHMSQFGFEATAVSAVGRDPLGDGIVAEFDARGLHHDLARVEYPTGTVEVTLDAQGIPCYDIRTEVAWDHIPFTAGLQQLAARTRCICFGSLAQRNPDSRRTIQRFLDAMPETSLRVFDINLRQQFYGREVVEESLERCNILKINDEEIVILSRMFGLPTDMTEAGLTLKRQYALQEVILTCGTRGSYVFHDRGISFLHTPQVEVADTVGAGDSFTAGVCASLLRGCPIPEAHARAVAVSAYVCSQHGAMPRLPEELLQGRAPELG